MNKYSKLLLFIFIHLVTVRAFAFPAADSVTSIYIKAVSGLQFDVVRFQVKPGAKVRLVLTNTDDMSHNLLITKPAAREIVVNAALKLEAQGPKLNFIPALPEVLWSIPVLSPDQAQSITFTAPKAPGAYPYVCTYFGHGPLCTARCM